MRKNHHGKKDRLVKRVFALCLALAVICTCLVPVFATEGLSDLQVEKELPGTSEEEAAGFGDDFPAVDDGEPREVYDDSEAAGFGGDEVATRPVEGGEEEATRPAEGEGGEDNPGEGGTVKETEWGTVIEYDTSTSTSTDPSSSTETQWSGEDDVVEKPDDKVVVSGDEIKKLQDMVVYRFWLKELNANDLQDITAQAQINNMTESEYLARNGEVLWNLYFIQAVPRVETIADYSSYIENPSSNRDPKGELRLFDYWYTLDEFGNRVRLNLTDPTSNILDDKTTTVNVYAAWKDGTVGSDEEEDVDHEDLVDKNPVPVDLTAKASTSYEDEDGELKTTTLPVEVKNLPSAAHSLSVIHMGDDDMESFYKSHSNDFGEMMPILGLKISPKNAKGQTVQPANGQKATVTISGLNDLPEMEGATASTLKVFHETSDGNVEILDVLTYTNGTLTFETTSFSPFVVVRTDGYDAELLDERAAKEITITVGKSESIKKEPYWPLLNENHIWESKDTRVAIVSGSGRDVTVTGKSVGNTTIIHKYRVVGQWKTEEYTVTVGYEEAAVYILLDTEKDPDSNATSEWTGFVAYNSQHAKLGDLTGATWKDNKNIFIGGLPGGTTGETAKKYIQSWPDGQQYNGPRVLARNDSSGFRKIDVTYDGKTGHLEDMILKKYRDTLYGLYEDTDFNQDEVKRLVDDLKANEITFTITPHKISKDNYVDKSSPRSKHIDCTVTVTCDLTFTAVFNAKDSTGNSYTSVGRKVYLWYKDDSDKNNVDHCPNDPSGYTDGDGVQWVFDGWYLKPQNADGTSSDENALTWPHNVKEEDLNSERVVNFYAHYRKATSDVTITKEVKGLLGDTKHDFDFSVSITTKDGVVYNGVKAEKANNVSVGDLSNFTLRHNETVTLKNVPIGATITVTEKIPGEQYTVFADGYESGKNGGQDVTFTYKVAAANTNTATAGGANEANLMLLSMDEDTAVDADAVALADATDKMVPNNAITVTNHCDLEPDLGVLLDTLPYIVILAVVAGGGILLMLRKRRKEDD